MTGYLITGGLVFGAWAIAKVAAAILMPPPSDDKLLAALGEHGELHGMELRQIVGWDHGAGYFYHRMGGLILKGYVSRRWLPVEIKGTGLGTKLMFFTLTRDGAIYLAEKEVHDAKL